jgi:hypothetical protein
MNPVTLTLIKSGESAEKSSDSSAESVEKSAESFILNYGSKKEKIYQENSVKYTGNARS